MSRTPNSFAKAIQGQASVKWADAVGWILVQSTGGFRGGSGGFRGGFRVVLEGVPRGFRGVPWGSVGFRGGFRGGSVVAPSIELNVFYHVSGDIDGGSAFQKAISAEPPFATCNFLLKLKKGK